MNKKDKKGENKKKSKNVASSSDSVHLGDNEYGQDCRCWCERSELALRSGDLDKQGPFSFQYRVSIEHVDVSELNLD